MKLIETYFPSWALKREKARFELEKLRVKSTAIRKYQAASGRTRLENWRKSRTSPNQELKASINALMARSQQQIRDNPYAKKMKRIIQTSIVGSGIFPSAIKSPLHDALWAEWGDTTECSYDKRSTIYKIQNLVVASLFETGGCFVRRYRRGDLIPLELQVIDAALCDFSKNVTLKDGYIKQGIEFDKFHRRRAYHLFEEYPDDAVYYKSYSSVRVPAEDIIHVYWEELAGMVHGIPWLHAILIRLKGFDEFEDAWLTLHKIAACLMAFITEPEPNEKFKTELTEAIEPGTVGVLPGGKGIEFTKPPHVAGSSEFGKQQLQGMCAGSSAPYERVTGNLKDVNWSSIRVSRSDFFEEMDQYIEFLMIPVFCEGIWKWFNEAAFLVEKVPKFAKTKWTPPKRTSPDPGKDALALKQEVRNGSKTPDDMVREMGKDPETHWKEMAENFEKLDNLGLVLDIDPRKIGGGGTAQKQSELVKNLQGLILVLEEKKEKLEKSRKDLIFEEIRDLLAVLGNGKRDFDDLERSVLGGQIEQIRFMIEE